MNSSIIYIYVFPLMLIILALDFLQMPKTYNRRDSFTNFVIFGISVGIKSFTKLIEINIYFFFYFLLMGFRSEFLGFEKIGNHWWSVGLAIILADFLYYWFHRYGHEIRLMWANHIVHHSSEHYNFTTSLRISWWTHFFKFLFWTPMAMIGFHPILIMYAMAIVDVYQYFLHTQHARDFGIFEKIFNTPRLHEVHHAKNPEYIDKNYGGIFIFWDRILGTYKAWDPQNEPVFGVSVPPKNDSVIEILTHEFVNIWKDLKRTNSMKEKWKVIFSSPSWSMNQFKDFKNKDNRIIEIDFTNPVEEGNRAA